ncbi:inorganic diphosphatase [Candidatus Gracilibacteria bacterium]|nr:inorganic diphosphatase [Candidatus Gracilibacteria bacterium]
MAINQWFEQLRTQFYARNYLGRTVTVVMDRPLGSMHPKHGFQYPVNYGYVPNTLAPDGEGIDAYVLGVDQPVATFQGRCIAIVHRLNDNDDKLIVVPEGTLMTDAAIRNAVHFQEQWFTSRIIRDRNQIYGYEESDWADHYSLGMVWYSRYFARLCAQ